MIKYLIRAGLIASLFINTDVFAQGPPITADKPIMLGAKTIVLRTLTEVRETDIGTFTRVPLMFHYLTTANSLVAIHVPYVNASFKGEANREDLSGLGDIQFLGKYQFYTKNAIGKTHRISVKTIQVLPTGEEINIRRISAGTYQSYVGIVSGYETLKYGISTEVGYNLMPDRNQDEFRTKLGFGLPLLKPKFPVRQVNLYFEYTGNWLVEQDAREILYAQGVQYARGRMTFEAALQWPISQTIDRIERRKYSLLLGTRLIF